jgi:hypothetical protein
MQLLKVYAGDGTALSGPAALGWPTVDLRVSQKAATLLVQWGDGAASSREQNVSLVAGRNHLAIVRDGDRLGRRALMCNASIIQHWSLQVMAVVPGKLGCIVQHTSATT